MLFIDNHAWNLLISDLFVIPVIRSPWYYEG